MEGAMRRAIEERVTRETKIRVELDLDGSGKTDIQTGIGFFDHMLEGFGRHGFFDLAVKCEGDLNVDAHHTVEDCGIVLGTAFKKALGDKFGIKRYGYFILPMDDALIMSAIDLSGRPYLGYDIHFTGDKLGEMDTALAKEFFYAFSYSALINIHLRKLSGENDHHIMEGAFKAFAKALDMAVMRDGRIEGVLSTKGRL